MGDGVVQCPVLQAQERFPCVGNVLVGGGRTLGRSPAQSACAGRSQDKGLLDGAGRDGGLCRRVCGRKRAGGKPPREARSWRCVCGSVISPGPPPAADACLAPGGRSGHLARAISTSSSVTSCERRGPPLAFILAPLGSGLGGASRRRHSSGHGLISDLCAVSKPLTVLWLKRGR